MGEFKEADVVAMEDPKLSLEEWKRRIDALIRMFGNGAIMYTDGGYNNVELKVKTKVKLEILGDNWLDED